MSKRIQECGYCGATENLNVDHVIPKCLMSTPYPDNLITVKACSMCHGLKNSSEKESFLRDLLTVDIHGNNSPIAQDIFKTKVMRSVERNSSELVSHALKHGQFEPFFSSGGIYLGHAFSAKIDPFRITDIFSMIVRGLFYHSRQEVMPSHRRFHVTRFQPSDFERIVAQFMSYGPTLCRELKGVFKGAYIAVEDGSSSMWLLCFYDQILVAVSAMSPDTKEPTVRQRDFGRPIDADVKFNLAARAVLRSRYEAKVTEARSKSILLSPRPDL